MPECCFITNGFILDPCDTPSSHLVEVPIIPLTVRLTGGRKSIHENRYLQVFWCQWERFMWQQVRTRHHRCSSAGLALSTRSGYLLLKACSDRKVWFDRRLKLWTVRVQEKHFDPWLAVTWNDTSETPHVRADCFGLPPASGLRKELTWILIGYVQYHQFTLKHGWLFAHFIPTVWQVFDCGLFSFVRTYL